MGGLRNAMVYLGLAEEEHEQSMAYDEQEHEASRPAPRAEAAQERGAAVTPIKRERAPQRVVSEPVGGELTRISTIHPRTYNDAKTIGESFREGVPVIMNLTDMDDSDAKRLVDFSAGLVFGLRGSIERVTSKVFLLSPAHVEVSAPAAAATSARAGVQSGFFNQS
ncbi:cell division protein SepF [Angustibacter speluncae]